jgi:hypothetical protein
MGSPKMKPGVIGTGKMVEDALFATQPDADEKENRKLLGVEAILEYGNYYRSFKGSDTVYI